MNKRLKEISYNRVFLKTLVLISAIIVLSFNMILNVVFADGLLHNKRRAAVLADSRVLRRVYLQMRAALGADCRNQRLVLISMNSMIHLIPTILILLNWHRAGRCPLHGALQAAVWRYYTTRPCPP